MGGAMAGTRLDERAALAALRNGEDADDEAFRLVYELYGPQVWAFAARLTGRPALADDVTQETFLKLYGARRRLEPGRPLGPYILRIAHNTALTSLRGERRRSARELAAPGAGPARDPAESASSKELGDAVSQALAQLEPEQRAALILRHEQGLTHRSLAEALGCSERTVRNRLRDARAALGAAMRAAGFDAPKGDESHD